MLRIDRMLDFGPVEFVDVEEDNSRHRFVRNPGDDISDLDTSLQDVVQAHWTPERVDAYNAMLEENTPPPPTAEELAEAQRVEDLKTSTLRQELVSRLAAATPTQIDTYVDNRISDPETAAMLKRILLVLSLVVRE